MLDPSKRSLIEAHFQIGLYIKETFVPKAYLFFMNIQKEDRHRKLSKNSSTDVKTKVSPRKATMVKPTKNPEKSSTINNNEEEPLSSPTVPNGEVHKGPVCLPEEDR